MSEFRYTPGPWTCIPGTNNDGIYHVWDGEENALTYDDGEHEANASLIAAAPDLLEALQVLIASVGSKPTMSVDAAEKLALSAIAKATGKKS